jgi:hypothetical protein
MANIDDIVAADLAATALATADSVSPAETITYKAGGAGAGESVTAVVVERDTDWDQGERGEDQSERAIVLLLASAVADPAAGVDTLLIGTDEFLVNTKTKAGGAWRLGCSRTERQERSYEGLRER